MRKRSSAGVLGTFSDVAATRGAIRALRKEGFGELTIYSPAAQHEIFAELEDTVSPVRFWTLIGGILGCASGFALTIFTSLDWPHRTGAKPIVSIPPFIIIAFELTILLAALGAVLGFLINAGLPRKLAKTSYDSRFSEDHMGILVPCSDRIERAQEILRNSGAEEVHIEEA